MLMKNFMYLGLGFLGCASVQFLSFLGFGFPKVSFGAGLLLLCILLAIIIAGAINWQGLRNQGYAGHDHVLVGFLPSIILGSLFLIFAIAGWYLAVGAN